MQPQTNIMKRKMRMLTFVKMILTPCSSLLTHVLNFSSHLLGVLVLGETNIPLQEPDTDEGADQQAVAWAGGREAAGSSLPIIKGAR